MSGSRPRVPTHTTKEKQKMALKEAQERYSAKIAEARAALAGGATAEAREKYDAIMKDAEAIAGDVRRYKQLEEAESEERKRAEAEEAARRSNQPNLPQPGNPEQRSEDETPAEKEKRQKAFRSAFTKFVRSNDTRELRALGSAVGTNGGYTIPTETLPEVELALQAFGGVASHLGDFSTSTGETINYPTNNDTTNMGAEIGENVAATEVDPAFASVASTVGLFTTNSVLVPRTLMRDSAVDVAALVSKLLGTRRARLLSKKIIEGTISNQTFDSLTGVATLGATTTAAGAISLADMANLFGNVDPGYGVNGKFVMHRNTQIYLMTQRNAYGTPIFPLDNDGFLTSLFGRPIVIDMNMPQMTTAGNLPILFGDLTKYLLRPVGTMEVQRLEERYAEFNQVGFLGFWSAGGRLVDAGTHPIQSLKMHA